MDLDILRNALLITLSITLVLALARRFRLSVLRKDMPAPLHAELIGLNVAYHPPRLHVEVKMPSIQALDTALLGSDHVERHRWPKATAGPGTLVLERSLEGFADGLYYLELRTSTQRTVRQFRLQQA